MQTKQHHDLATDAPPTTRNPLRMSLATQASVVLVVLVLVSALAAAAIVYFGARAALVDTLTTQVTHDTEIVGARIAAAAAETTGDVERLAGRLSGARLLSLRPGDDGAAHTREELSDSFEILLATRPDYSWIAYSDLVDRDTPPIVVRRGGDESDAVGLDAEALESVRQVAALQVGEIYLSELHRHRDGDDHGHGEAGAEAEHAEDEHGDEHAEHETNGALVSGTNITGPDGEVIGAIVIERSVVGLFASLSDLVHPLTSIYVLNAEGACIHHPHHVADADGDPCEEQTVLAEFPGLAPLLDGTSDHVHIDASSPDGDRPVVVDFRRIRIGDESAPQSVLVGTVASRDVMLGGLASVRSQAGGLLVLLLLASAGLGLFATRRFTRPIAAIASSLQRFGSPEWKPGTLPVGRNDEVGGLARSVSAMSTKIEHQIEELEQQEVLLRESKDSAEAASKAKSDFLANMSHELRTPLNAIIGYSEMLLEEADALGQDEFKPDLDKIRGAGKHLLSLINDILDLSKIEAGKMDVFVETFAVEAMLDDVQATISPLIKQNDNTIDIRLAPGLGTLRSDQVKVRQTLFNLLSNAAKFTHEGQITLEATRQGGEHGHALTFRVTDTGIGMTPPQVERLFRAFEQADASTRRVYGGTGLGLAITQHFCHMLGGEVAVTSRKGRGSTFTITLPAEIEPEDAAQPYEMAATLAPGDAGVVLAIDDERGTHDFFEEELGRHGFQVIHAHSGRDGLKLAREMRPDAITLDIIMPEVDGWSVLRSLKADPDLRDIPVILVTVLGNREMGFTLGAVDYLTKPVDAADLLQVVGRAVENRTSEILVVDDDPATRDMLRRMLTKDGRKVATAVDGRDALAQLERFRPGLVVLDLMMPHVDGFEVLETIRRHPTWQTIPVLILTAKDLSRKEHEWLLSQTQHVFRKGGYDRKELVEVIRRTLDAAPGAAQRTDDGKADGTNPPD